MTGTSTTASSDSVSTGSYIESYPERQRNELLLLYDLSASLQDMKEFAAT
eukprot:CAMPEP_0178990684 /NCGR_PEP_ID=MMETSP0795-20121207/5101_1 /TAXON_ID=88552 /ORGANISM="Amoebophrya sp., Strain Ameob2" /LENGTH=49 /DNA_ID=CAMNT_0020682293 /DNA_START=42 /DNA_END=191 /DNA_ORIENTATION=-